RSPGAATRAEPFGSGSVELVDLADGKTDREITFVAPRVERRLAVVIHELPHRDDVRAYPLVEPAVVAEVVHRHGFEDVLDALAGDHLLEHALFQRDEEIADVDERLLRRDAAVARNDDVDVLHAPEVPQSADRIVEVEIAQFRHREALAF